HRIWSENDEALPLKQLKLAGEQACRVRIQRPDELAIEMLNPKDDRFPSTFFAGHDEAISTTVTLAIYLGEPLVEYRLASPGAVTVSVVAVPKISAGTCT
ncbi:hypothetical protein, partial [Brevundimonas sp. ZS04]|uniref:hypothetical protein n=1 Tax=Brevundimonas sp. ZS04 TaxID=1906854 RepID=UPI00097B57F1